MAFPADGPYAPSWIKRLKKRIGKKMKFKLDDGRKIIEWWENKEEKVIQVFKGRKLIKRMKLKIGGRVKVTEGLTAGYTGILIALCPYDFRCIVEFDNYHRGSNVSEWWDAVWYPDEYRTPSDSRKWEYEYELEPIQQEAELGPTDPWTLAPKVQVEKEEEKEIPPIWGSKVLAGG